MGNMSNRLEGVEHGLYTTERDGGLLYTYDLVWLAEGRSCRWQATVKRNGQTVGQLEREISDCHGLDPMSLASAQLHYAIENSVERE
jgi:hypothetical protein